MRAIFFLAILAALPAPLAAQPAPSTDWRVAAADAAGTAGQTVGASVSYVDVNSIVRRGQIVEFTMEARFLNQRQADGINGVRALMRAECDTMRWSAVSTTTLRGTAPVRSFGPNEMRETREGTNGRLIVIAACTGRYETGTIADPIAHAERLLAGR